MRSTLLQISDPHFGTERLPVVAALLDLARELRPDLVVLSGDITQRARAAQFEKAAAFVRQLKTPRVLAIPGNHDIPLFNLFARAFDPYSGFVKVFGRDLEPQYSSDALLVVAVNTTRPKRHKDGEVSPVQIARVANCLRNARPEQLRIVVVHQPVHVIRTQDVDNLLRGHQDAVRAWDEAGADVIMGGHIHLPYVRALDEHIAGVKRRLWAVQAGTAVSYRVRNEAPNSVNVLRYEAGEPACDVEQWDYAAEEGRFQPKERRALEVDRGSEKQRATG
ncbi:MAG TPA: metallophosphoesterase family protein [Steroidobacteraceae bacterium]